MRSACPMASGSQTMQKAYPHVESLQSTTLGEVFAFEHLSGEFVQVLNVLRWLCKDLR